MWVGIGDSSWNSWQWHESYAIAVLFVNQLGVLSQDHWTSWGFLKWLVRKTGTSVSHWHSLVILGCLFNLAGELYLKVVGICFVHNCIDSSTTFGVVWECSCVSFGRFQAYILSCRDSKDFYSMLLAGLALEISSLGCFEFRGKCWSCKLSVSDSQKAVRCTSIQVCF